MVESGGNFTFLHFTSILSIFDFSVLKLTLIYLVFIYLHEVRFRTFLPFFLLNIISIRVDCWSWQSARTDWLPTIVIIFSCALLETVGPSVVHGWNWTIEASTKCCSWAYDIRWYLSNVFKGTNKPFLEWRNVYWSENSRLEVEHKSSWM